MSLDFNGHGRPPRPTAPKAPPAKSESVILSQQRESLGLNPGLAIGTRRHAAVRWVGNSEVKGRYRPKQSKTIQKVGANCRRPPKCKGRRGIDREEMKRQSAIGRAHSGISRASRHQKLATLCENAGQSRPSVVSKMVAWLLTNMFERR